jgi:hypothetical protein
MQNFRYSRGEPSIVRDPHFFAWGPRELYISLDLLA